MYEMDEFSFYTFNRIDFRPNKPSKIRAVFCTIPPEKEFIEVCVGPITLKNKAEAEKLLVEGTDDPKANSIYTCVIRFDERLIQTFDIDQVKTVEQFMDNVPICCLNKNVKKILWEELHKNQAHLLKSSKDLMHIGPYQKMGRAVTLQRTDGARVIERGFTLEKNDT